MKKHFVMIGIGVFFLIIGSSLSYYYANSLSEKYPELEILFSNVMLEPTQSITGSITLEKGEKIFVTLIAEPIFNPIYFSIKSTENSVAKEFTFTDVASFPINANSTGDYILNIGNIGSATASVHAFSTNREILDDNEVVFSLGTGMLIGSSLVIFGIILIIIGAIIFLINKKHSKNNLTKKK